MVFKVGKLDINGLLIVNKFTHTDNRGSFSEIFKKSDFDNIGLPSNLVQDNLVYSTKNTLRGLHYQTSPFMQGKLINVIKGKIFDVAVDIRSESHTYGHWLSFVIDAKDNKMLYIPEGFAHGYCVLSEDALISYKTTSEYSLDSENGIKWNDEILGINWPIEKPILSSKDLLLPSFIDESGDYSHRLEV